MGWGCGESTRCDEVVDVGEAVVAGAAEVFGELGGGDVAVSEGFGADGPDGGDPGEAGAGVPLVGEVEPLAGADGWLDCFAGFEGEQGGVADEEGSVGLLQHGDGVGGCGKNAGWCRGICGRGSRRRRGSCVRLCRRRWSVTVPRAVGLF